MIGVTLSRYFAWRFLRTILGIFLTIFCLMFVIVFVELLRRVSDNPQTGPGTVALMSIMRAPYSTEMILPFAVLFGSMATFVDLTRKLELVVARAVGHVGLAVSGPAPARRLLPRGVFGHRI